MKQLFIALIMCTMLPFYAFAEDAAKPAAAAVVAPAAKVEAATAAPAVEAAPAVAEAPKEEVSLGKFLGDVLETAKNLGGLPWAGKIAALILLIIASMKVTVVNNLLWSKLGWLQGWMAPFLGLLAGLISLIPAHQFTWAGVLAYVGAGAGAIALHELLDSLKKIPKLGAMWVSLIDLISKAVPKPLAVKKDAEGKVV